MSEERLPDWLCPTTPRPLSVAEQHLGVLRDLLRRNLLGRADWDQARGDLARMACSALGAARTLVALLDAATSRWSAVTSEGERLEDEQISAHGSRAVLETVLATGQPLLTTRLRPLELRSESLLSQNVGSVLAVPLHFWDVTAKRPERHLGGCLYAHRTAEQPPFAEADIALVLDIAGIAQPNLNLLRYLQKVESDLLVSREELLELRQEAAEKWSLGRYETQDAHFARTVLAPLRRVASAPKVNLLILGPTGSGKSHLAHAYHYECSRRGGPFVTLDCSQVVSAETLAAELFGYASSSGYANAPPRGRPGKAKLADGGTLFIDEIGCLPAELQPRLLRLIQSGLYSPLGTSDEAGADLQIIAATNEDLPQLVQQRRFREDLYWRLREISVYVPPLSQRPADIPDLAQRFLAQAARRYSRPELRGLSAAAVRALVRCDWSRAGNLRGLEHTINRAVLMAAEDARQLEEADLEPERALGAGPLGPATAGPDGSPVLPPRSRKSAASLDRVRAAILEHGTGTAAARALGISRDALVWRLRQAGLTVGQVLEDGA